jgi:hypothetical protein
MSDVAGQRGILSSLREPDRRVLIAKWSIICFAHREFFDAVVRRPLLLIDCQEEAARFMAQAGGGRVQQPELAGFLQDPLLVGLLAKDVPFPRSIEVFQKLVHLSASLGVSTASRWAGPVQLERPPNRLIEVRAAEVTMGSGRKVKVAEFLIDPYPVTNRQYAEFLKSDSTLRPPPSWSKILQHPERLDHPVVEVDWEDAKRYCDWRSRTEGRTVRLPFEAEWEWAARGDDGRTWPWGDWDPRQPCANTRETGNAGTTRVGLYPAGKSAFGAYDMAGNVWEWTLDHWEGNPADPSDPINRQFVIVRGGAWYDHIDEARCTNRGSTTPDDKDHGIGFRCVTIPDPTG